MARAAGWTRVALGARIGMSTTMLSHVRAGAKSLSAPQLGRILRAFRGQPRIRNLVLHYLDAELEQRAADALPP